MPILLDAGNDCDRPGHPHSALIGVGQSSEQHTSPSVLPGDDGSSRGPDGEPLLRPDGEPRKRKHRDLTVGSHQRSIHEAVRKMADARARQALAERDYAEAEADLNRYLGQIVDELHDLGDGLDDMIDIEEERASVHCQEVAR